MPGSRENGLGFEHNVAGSDLGAWCQRVGEAAAAMDWRLDSCLDVSSEVRLGMPARSKRSLSKVRPGKTESRSADGLTDHLRWWIGREPNNGGTARE